MALSEATPQHFDHPVGSALGFTRDQQERDDSESGGTRLSCSDDDIYGEEAPSRLSAAPISAASDDTGAFNAQRLAVSLSPLATRHDRQQWQPSASAASESLSDLGAKQLNIAKPNKRGLFATVRSRLSGMFKSSASPGSAAADISPRSRLRRAPPPVSRATSEGGWTSNSFLLRKPLSAPVAPYAKIQVLSAEHHRLDAPAMRRARSDGSSEARWHAQEDDESGIQRPRLWSNTSDNSVDSDGQARLNIAPSAAVLSEKTASHTERPFSVGLAASAPEADVENRLVAATPSTVLPSDDVYFDAPDQADSRTTFDEAAAPHSLIGRPEGAVPTDSVFSTTYDGLALDQLLADEPLLPTFEQEGRKRQSQSAKGARLSKAARSASGQRLKSSSSMTREEVTSAGTETLKRDPTTKHAGTTEQIDGVIARSAARTKRENKLKAKRRPAAKQLVTQTIPPAEPPADSAVEPEQDPEGYTDASTLDITTPYATSAQTTSDGVIMAPEGQDVSTGHVQTAGTYRGAMVDEDVEDQVQFSAYAPPIMARGATCKVGIWAYVAAQAQEMHEVCIVRLLTGRGEWGRAEGRMTTGWQCHGVL